MHGPGLRPPCGGQGGGQNVRGLPFRETGVSKKNFTMTLFVMAGMIVYYCIFRYGE